MHIYEGHMGGLYATEEILDYDDMYCGTCGDSDTYLGSADNAAQARKLLGNDKYVKKFIKETFSKQESLELVSMNRYKIKSKTTIGDVVRENFREGGSWINKDCKLFKTICLLDSIELNIGFNTVEDWDDFEYVEVLDDDFCQPYTPFYGDNYGKEICNFKFLQKVVKRYNEEMDKIKFIEKISV